MRKHPGCIHKIYYVINILLIVCMIFPVSLAVQAADDLTSLIKEFEASMINTPGGSQESALKVLSKYKEYEGFVNAKGSTISRNTVEALDNHLYRMCRETWRDVSLNQGNKLSHIIPVGTLGQRGEPGGKFIPGKSDYDFIPQGTNASEAAEDFSSKFIQKWKIDPNDLGVHVLDPTKIETWGDRVEAAANYEKYNTKGGNIWLENKLYNDNPKCWVYNPIADTLGDVNYVKMAGEKPKALTAVDAFGFASDNIKFRESILVSKEYSESEKVLKTFKYDLRNLQAYELAGGKLTPAEQELVGLARIFETPGITPEDAINEMMRRTGMSAEDVAEHYLNGMNQLNKNMSKKVAETFLDMMTSGKQTEKLASELAAAMANLPPGYLDEVEGIAIQKLGKYEYQEISQMTKVFKERISQRVFGTTYFNERAMDVFGRSYDQLNDSEKALLHGADEAVEGFAEKSFKALGYTANALFAGYAIYSAYQEGKQRGESIGYMSAGGQAFIELLEFGYPVAVAVDIVARLSAGVMNLGISAYKNNVLENMFNELITEYDGRIDEMLNTYGIAPGKLEQGGLRQVAIEMRKENPNITDEEITAAIKEYFSRRIQTEKIKTENLQNLEQLKTWLRENHVELTDKPLEVDDLCQYYEKECNAKLAAWLQKYAMIRAQLEKDGLPLNPDNIYYIVSRLLQGSHEDYIKAMKEYYADYKKVFPPAENKKPPIAVLKLGSGASITVSNPPMSPGMLWSGGGSFAEHGVDQPCDPAQVFGPFNVSGGAKAKAVIKGSPPVQQRWSLYNWNSSMRVYFAQKIGKSFGNEQKIAELSGQNEDSDLQQEFDIPGAGKIRIVIGAPAGSGPLSGACFGQGYSASLEILAAKNDSVASAGENFNAGDKLTTSNSPAVLVLEDGTRLTVQRDSAVSFDIDTTGMPVVRLEKGKIRFTSPAQGGKPIVVKVGDKTIVRHGTDFSVVSYVSDWANEHTVSVNEGSVTAVFPDGTEIEVDAGKAINLDSGALSDYSVNADEQNRYHGLKPKDIFIGDDIPEPAGMVTGPSESDPLDAGWIWQDPGYNATIHVINGVTEIDVPHGDCIGDYCDNSPVFMHKVTGDFDLQTRALLIGPNDRWITLDFIIYAPDSFLGFLAGQVPEDSLFAHTLQIGSGWRRESGRSVLRIFNDISSKSGKEIQDLPVLLRLTRRGDIFNTYWSIDDGLTWNLSSRTQINVPDTLYTGWTFIYGGQWPGDPAVAKSTLSEISLISGPQNSLSKNEWDVVSGQGSVEIIDESTVKLKLDGSVFGDASVYLGEILSGNFELIASYKTELSEHQQGESRAFFMAVENVEGIPVNGVLDKYQRIGVGAFQTDNGNKYVTKVDYKKIRDASWNTLDAIGNEGKFRLLRNAGVITSYVDVNGEWIQIDKGYVEQISEPVVPVFQVSNTMNAAIPTPLEVTFKVEKLTREDMPENEVQQPFNTETNTNLTEFQFSTEAQMAEIEQTAVGQSETTPVEPFPPADVEQWFTDDFSRGTNAWKIMSDLSNGSLFNENEELVFEVTKPNKYVSAEVPWNFTGLFTNTTISVDVKVVTPGMGGFGFFCRENDPNNFYSVTIIPDAAGGGAYRFYKKVAGNAMYLTDWIQTDALYGGEITEQIVFSCKGSKLILDINGQKEAEITDFDLGFGKAIIFAVSMNDVDEKNPYRVAFDNFKATVP